MKKYYQVLRKADIFKGLSYYEIEMLLNSLQATVVTHNKGEYLPVLRQPEPRVGVLLNGFLLFLKNNADWYEKVIERIPVGGIFGETHLFYIDNYFSFNIMAHENSTVLYLSYKKIIKGDSKLSVLYSKLTNNLFRIYSKKIINLSKKLDHLGKLTIRGKMLLYFEGIVSELGTREFLIPHTKKELAEIFGINRSALSRELGNMVKEGIISYEGKEFRYLL